MNIYINKALFCRLIMPSSIEVIDISTEDPFTENNIPDWLAVEQFQQIDSQAMKILAGD